MEALATPTVVMIGREELMPTNGVEDLIPSIRTYYWDMPTVKLVLLLIIASALFGLISELLTALLAYWARRHALSH